MRMGRSGRKDYYEKITVSVGPNSECRGEKGLCTTVRVRFSDGIGAAEARSREPRWMPLLAQD